MNAQEKLNRFEAVFCNTLKVDDKGTFVRIPIEDYEDLNFFKYYIAHAIDLVAALQADTAQTNELGYTLQVLAHILKSTSMFEECSGIKELITK